MTQYSYYLFKSILKYGKDAVFVCNKQDKYEGEASQNVACILERTRLLPLSVLKLLWFLFFNHIEVVHFQSFFKYPVVTHFLIKVLKMGGKKTLFTVHDIVPHYQKAWDPYFSVKIYKEIDGIVVHSKTNKRELINKVGSVGPTKVIPHPLNSMYNPEENLDKASAKKRIGISNEKRILLFFGRIDRRKGAEAIIREFPKLIRKDRSLHLVLAGSVGFPKGYLADLVSKLKISSKVSIIDRYIPDNEVGVFFTAADAVVLPYLRGTTSGVLKIAFSFMIPVIATRVGELPETIKEYNAGITVDLPLNQSDIGSIVSLIQNPKAMELYSNYDELLDYFSWVRIAEKTIAFYDQVAGK